MQTRISLDNELIERAQKLTGIKAKSKAVQEALRALTSMPAQKSKTKEKRIFSKKRGNVPKVSSKAWLSRSNLRDGVPCPRKIEMIQKSRRKP
jgi:Arc/MetJ family transcription regulator